MTWVRRWAVCIMAQQVAAVHIQIYLLCRIYTSIPTNTTYYYCVQIHSLIRIGFYSLSSFCSTIQCMLNVYLWVFDVEQFKKADCTHRMIFGKIVYIVGATTSYAIISSTHTYERLIMKKISGKKDYIFSFGKTPIMKLILKRTLNILIA